MFSLLVYAAPFVLGVVLLLALVNVVGNFNRARSAPYFRIRRAAAQAGWRWLLVALVCGGGIYGALSLRDSVEPPDLTTLLPAPRLPGPTATFDINTLLTVTAGGSAATHNPLISPPTITPTLPPTTPPPTPFITTIAAPVTASPDAVIKLAAISTGISASLEPVDPGTFFSSGQPRIYFFITFDKMTNGLSWSRALIIDGKVYSTVTAAWDQGLKGNAYYWFESQSGFPVGSYQVQFYIGDKLSAQGAFTLR